MATLKVISLSKDGIMLAYVQVTHNRKVGRINTNIYVRVPKGFEMCLPYLLLDMRIAFKKNQ